MGSYADAILDLSSPFPPHEEAARRKELPDPPSFSLAFFLFFHSRSAAKRARPTRADSAFRWWRNGRAEASPEPPAKRQEGKRDQTVISTALSLSHPSSRFSSLVCVPPTVFFPFVCFPALSPVTFGRLFPLAFPP